MWNLEVFRFFQVLKVMAFTSKLSICGPSCWVLWRSSWSFSRCYRLAHRPNIPVTLMRTFGVGGIVCIFSNRPKIKKCKISDLGPNLRGYSCHESVSAWQGVGSTRPDSLKPVQNLEETKTLANFKTGLLTQGSFKLYIPEDYAHAVHKNCFSFLDWLMQATMRQRFDHGSYKSIL